MAYRYYSDAVIGETADRRAHAALRLSRECAHPARNNPDYLVLRHRARLLDQWVRQLEGESLDTLDVGGRLQPYRQMLESHSRSYLAVDPQFEGLADIIAVAEKLPFPNESFDIVLCAQVLSYAQNPFDAVKEMHRVLRPGGHLFLSAPSFCPQYHDERWRFLREGMELLLGDFSEVDVRPEVGSFAGGLRTANKIVNEAHSGVARQIVSRVIVPLLNRLGLIAERRSSSSEFLAPNYSAWARK